MKYLVPSSGAAREASGSMRPGALVLGKHQHTLQSFKYSFRAEI